MIKLTTKCRQAVQCCPAQYEGSSYVFKAWELPQNTTGHQWLIHKANNVRCSRTLQLVGTWWTALQRWISWSYIVIKTVFHFKVWQTVETLAGQGLAFGFFVAYEAAIEEKLLEVLGLNLWWCAETECTRREDPHEQGHLCHSDAM